MPGLLYLTVLSRRMWNVADEVSLTPNYTDFFFFTGSCHTLDWGRGGEKKKEKENRVKHMEARGTDGNGQMETYHRWFWRMEALCSHVASRGDKFCTVAANSGQAVVAVDSWRAQRAESSPAMSLNKHHNSFFCPRAGPSGISLNANMKMMSAHGDLMNLKAQRGTHTHTHTPVCQRSSCSPM